MKRASVVGFAQSSTDTVARVDIKERMEFLKEDLAHLFDEQGVDESQYDNVVTFLDPITKYNSVQGYMFNIRMLKSVFAPVFELHDIKQTGEYEATSRWTMTMKFTPAKALGISKWWSPVIIFTGTSAYGFNPSNGKINRHVDTWDSIQNQKFFSFEAFGDFLKQMSQTYTTPALETPQYTVLKRTAKFQVRRYQPFLVAETNLDNLPSTTSSSTGTTTSSSALDKDGTHSSNSLSSNSINPASPGMKAFNALAGYIFGGNAGGRKMSMTMPVLSDTSGRMQFVVEGGPQQADLNKLPTPSNASVHLRQQPGGIYAAAVFNGVATPRRCKEVHSELLTALQEAGLQPVDSTAWSLARYNDPSVKPRFRRNEVLTRLQDFDLWA